MLSLALLTVMVLGANAVALDKQPNIIFMFADDLGNNDVEWHDSSVSTPNLLAMMNDGIELDNNYVQPACTPSRAALMTGMYPIHIAMQHGVVKPTQSECIPLHQDLVSNAMKDLGYDTHMLGKWHLGFCDWECTPTYRGFDTFYGFYQGYIDHYTHEMGMSGMMGYDFKNGTEHCNQAGQYAVPLLRDRAIEIIENHDDPDTPFYMYLSWTTPHNPYEAQPEWYDMYADVEDDARRNYLGMISNMDQAIGEVKDALDRTGLLDNTIIIFMADNGGEAPTANNSPYRSAKCSFFEGGIKSTGIAYSPLFQKKGYKADQLVHVTDWFPTFVALGGGSVDGLDGKDQSDFLINGGPSARDEFLINIDDIFPQSYGARAIRSGDYKLIHGYPGQEDGRYPNIGKSYEHCRWDILGEEFKRSTDMTKRSGYVLTEEQLQQESDCISASADDLRLYNLADDPYEEVNLAADLPDVVDELLAKLDEYETTILPVPHYAEQILDEGSPNNFGGYWEAGWCDMSLAVYE